MSSSFLSRRGTSRSLASVVKVVGIAVLVIGLLLVFSGCGKASLVGKWNNAEQGTMEFTSDGKLTLTSEETGSVELAYKAEEGKMTLNLAGMDMATVDYAIDGDTLTMDDPETGEPLTFQRVK